MVIILLRQATLEVLESFTLLCPKDFQKLPAVLSVPKDFARFGEWLLPWGLTLCYTHVSLTLSFLHDKTEVLKHASFILQTLDFKSRPYFISSNYGFYEMGLAVGDV